MQKRYQVRETNFRADQSAIGALMAKVSIWIRIRTNEIFSSSFEAVSYTHLTLPTTAEV